MKGAFSSWLVQTLVLKSQRGPSGKIPPAKKSFSWGGKQLQLLTHTNGFETPKSVGTPACAETHLDRKDHAANTFFEQQFPGHLSSKE